MLTHFLTAAIHVLVFCPPSNSPTVTRIVMPWAVKISRFRQNPTWFSLLTSCVWWLSSLVPWLVCSSKPAMETNSCPWSCGSLSRVACICCLNICRHSVRSSLLCCPVDNSHRYWANAPMIPCIIRVEDTVPSRRPSCSILRWPVTSLLLRIQVGCCRIKLVIFLFYFPIINSVTGSFTNLYA